MSEKSQPEASNPKLDENQVDQSNTNKDPDDWVTGGEPMTGAQASYLKTLSDETGEEFNPSLSKGEASKRIDELRSRDSRLTKGKTEGQ